MRRRTYLGLIGSSGLSGCTALSDASTKSNEESTHLADHTDSEITSQPTTPAKFKETETAQTSTSYETTTSAEDILFVGDWYSTYNWAFRIDSVQCLSDPAINPPPEVDAIEHLPGGIWLVAVQLTVKNIHDRPLKLYKEDARFAILYKESPYYGKHTFEFQSGEELRIEWIEETEHRQAHPPTGKYGPGEIRESQFGVFVYEPLTPEDVTVAYDTLDGWLDVRWKPDSCNDENSPSQC